MKTIANTIAVAIDLGLFIVFLLFVKGII